MSNYYIKNKETGKLELHFEKADYMALSSQEKAEIKSSFLFSRFCNGWVSRCKFPNLYRAEQVAKKLGLEYLGEEGETLSFAEQQERIAERAERRAERMEYKAEKAMERGEELQKPINNMKGDIAFFTQPNINTSSGRAFARQRQRMFDAWDRGFEEFKKSQYYSECAERARQTAGKANTQDKGFCQRRINDAEANIRALKRNIQEYEGYRQQVESGETPKNKYGWEMNVTENSINSNIERWEEMLQTEIEKSIYYREALEAAGGVIYSKDNLHKGDLVKVKRWGTVRVLRFGSKNMTFEFTDSRMTYADGTPIQGKCSYAEIESKVKSA